MTLLGRIAAIHIINATPSTYKRAGLPAWLVILISACFLVLLGKLT